MKRQNGGENWGGANGTFDANASFSQNWLEADGTNEPVGGAPRVVGRLPNVSENGALENSLKSAKTSRRPAVRTAGVAVAAFGLGVAATLGGAFCWNGFGISATSNFGAVAEVDASASDAGSVAAASENGANVDFSSDSLTQITSSTLRSVPEEGANGAFGDASGAFSESLSDEIYSVNRGFNGFGATNSVASTDGGAEISANSAAAPFPSETSSLADEIVRPGGRRNVAPTSANGWNGNDGGALENRPTQIADVPGTVVAEREIYPTWEDLEADAARGRAVAAQTSQIAQVPQAPPVDYSANASIDPAVQQIAAQNPQFPQTAQNPNVVAPQASEVGGFYAANVPQNPQASNVANGQNFASAPVAAGYPQVASVPVASNEQNFGNVSETANYPQVANVPTATDFPTADDYAAIPANSVESGDFGDFANSGNPGGFEDFANPVGGAYPEYPTNAAPVDDLARRRFVAQVPTETANAAQYPSQNAAPVAAPARNLRW